MAIKELTKETLGKTKAGWFYDRKREVWTTWQVDTIYLGTRHIRRGFRTEAEAEAYLKQLDEQERLKELGVVQILKFPLVKELFARHRKTLTTRKQITVFDRVTKYFLAMLPKTILLDELRRKHFKDFCDRRMADGIKAESANREITELSAAIHKAGDYFENLEKWSPPEKLIYRPSFEATERDRVISSDERERLIAHLLSDRKPNERDKDFTARRRAGLVLYFKLLTGLRHGEVCALKKTDLTGRRLKAQRFKTKKKGVAVTVFEPLTNTQMWVLEEASKIYPEGEYFFSEHGKKHNKIYETLKLHCGRLGIPYGKNVENGFVPHDARHTFVTVLEHGAIDSSTTRSFSGHSKESMLKRYAHATVGSRARAMEIIESEVALNGSRKDDKLRAVFEAVRGGELAFEDFEKWARDIKKV